MNTSTFLPEAQQLTEQLIKKHAQPDGIESVYELKLQGLGINIIQNLQGYIKLKSLDLSSNYISRIQNLDSNTGLRELRLYFNRITKMESLDKLRELQTLILHANQITAIDGLGTLMQLSTLRLDNNNITKIQNIKNRTLTHINLSFNKISKIEGLENLKNLEELILTDNQIAQIESLEHCQQLNELHLSGNLLSSALNLKMLTKLQILRVDNNKFSNLDAFPKMTSLLELYIAGNTITDLGKLPNLFPNLEVLDVSNNQIHELKTVLYLEKMVFLVEIFLNGNPVVKTRNYRPQICSKLTQLEMLDGTEVVADDLIMEPEEDLNSARSRPKSAKRPGTSGSTRPGTAGLRPGSSGSGTVMRPMTSKEVNQYSFMLSSNDMEWEFLKVKKDFSETRLDFEKSIKRTKDTVKTALDHFDVLFSTELKNNATVQMSVMVSRPITAARSEEEKEDIRNIFQMGEDEELSVSLVRGLQSRDRVSQGNSGVTPPSKSELDKEFSVEDDPYINSPKEYHHVFSQKQSAEQPLNLSGSDQGNQEPIEEDFEGQKILELLEDGMHSNSVEHDEMSERSLSVVGSDPEDVISDPEEDSGKNSLHSSDEMKNSSSFEGEKESDSVEASMAALRTALSSRTSVRSSSTERSPKPLLIHSLSALPSSSPSKRLSTPPPSSPSKVFSPTKPSLAPLQPSSSPRIRSSSTPTGPKTAIPPLSIVPPGSPSSTGPSPHMRDSPKHHKYLSSSMTGLRSLQPLEGCPPFTAKSTSLSVNTSRSFSSTLTGRNGSPDELFNTAKSPKKNEVHILSLQGTVYDKEIRNSAEKITMDIPKERKLLFEEKKDKLPSHQKTVRRSTLHSVPSDVV